MVLARAKTDRQLLELAIYSLVIESSHCNILERGLDGMHESLKVTQESYPRVMPNLTVLPHVTHIEKCQLPGCH